MSRIFLRVSYKDKEKAKVALTRHWEGKDLWSFDVAEARLLADLFPDQRLKIKQQYLDIIDKENQSAPDRLGLVDKYKFKLKPYPYQVDVLKKILLYPHYGLFLDMGLGKTKIIIDYVNMIKQFEDPDIKILVVMPNTIIENWLEEIALNSDLNGIALTGTPKRRLKLLQDEEVIENNTFFLINYEGIAPLFTHKVFKTVRGRQVEVRVINEDVDRSIFKMVVLDESSKIKNPQANRTKYILKLFQDTIYKYILTGTPVTQNILDIYSQFSFLDPNFLGHKSYYTFRNHYCIMGGFNNYEIIGYKDIDGLKKKIRAHSVRLRKEKCLPWLPPKTYDRRTVELKGEMKKHYVEMNKEMVIEFKDKTITAPIVLTKLQILQQITSGHFLADPMSNSKIQELKDIIQDYRGSGNKFVIWFRFIPSLLNVAKMLSKEGVSYVELRGATTGRQDNINRFNNDDSVEVILCQLQTGGVGVNLQSGNTVIYFENNFSSQDRRQSEDRSHRSGTKKSVVYIDLVFKNTIDEKIINALRAKKEVSDYLIEEYRK